jgi:hypothetical protein
MNTYKEAAQADIKDEVDAHLEKIQILLSQERICKSEIKKLIQEAMDLLQRQLIIYH